MMKNSMFVALSYKIGDEIYRNNETHLICQWLNKNGYECNLFDWRSLFDDNAEEQRKAILGSMNIVHRHVGPIRKGSNHAFVRYLDTLSRVYPNTIINTQESYFLGIRKTYLIELQGMGLPVVPTVSLPSNCYMKILMQIGSSFGSREFVLKPDDGELGQDVMLGSEITKAKLERAANRTDRFLVQPLLEGVRQGEKSVVGVAIDGEHFPIYGVVRVPKDWKAVSAQCERIVEAEVNNHEKGLISELFQSRVFKFFNSGFFRVDFIYHNQTGFLSEVEIVNPQGGLEYVQNNKVQAYMTCFVDMLKH